MRLPIAAILATLLTTSVAALAKPTLDWPGYGHDPQHSGISTVAGRRPLHVRWSTPVDLQPQYNGDLLLIHYGSPLITRRNTVVVTVKVGATDGFRLEGHRGDTGELLWTEPTDYILPPHNWTPSLGAALPKGKSLVFPGAGGTVIRRNSPDRTQGSLRRFAFYGIKAYEADPATFADTVTITTPITADTRGNLFFGFTADAGAPLGLASGIARLSRSGKGTWISAAMASGDAGMHHVPYGAAPALSLDGRVVYVSVATGSGFSTGYLLALDSRTLAPIANVRLRDAHDANQLAWLVDDGTASPTVGPDGDAVPSSTSHAS